MQTLGRFMVVSALVGAVYVVVFSAAGHIVQPAISISLLGAFAALVLGCILASIPDLRRTLEHAPPAPRTRTGRPPAAPVHAPPVTSGVIATGVAWGIIKFFLIVFVLIFLLVFVLVIAGAILGPISG